MQAGWLQAALLREVRQSKAVSVRVQHNETSTALLRAGLASV